jgi:hypothetical protein
MKVIQMLCILRGFTDGTVKIKLLIDPSRTSTGNLNLSNAPFFSFKSLVIEMYNMCQIRLGRLSSKRGGGERKRVADLLELDITTPNSNVELLGIEVFDIGR